MSQNNKLVNSVKSVDEDDDDDGLMDLQTSDGGAKWIGRILEILLLLIRSI